MRKILPLLLLLAASCNVPAPRVGASPPPGRVIGFDPSVVGLPAALNTTVYDSGGVISWVKYGAANTAWRPVPVSTLTAVDPTTGSGLKAPIGYVVSSVDGTSAWMKTGTGDTAWQSWPGALGSLPSGNAALFSCYSTGTIDLTAAGVYDVNFPATGNGGKTFHAAITRIEVDSKSGTATGNASYTYSQNGVNFSGSAYTVAVATSLINNATTFPFTTTLTSTVPAIDPTIAHALQFNVTAGLSGITSCSGRYVVCGYWR